jgi:hypothetical protein
MAVVVRRAEAAEATARQVDRLLGSPVAAADMGWTASVGPDPVAAAREMRALREDSVYSQSHARVVAAEVWAATLPDVPSAFGGQKSLLGALSPKVSSAYAQAAAHTGSEAGFLSDVRDAACKLPQAEQEALTPALVNLAQAVEDAAVANRAARRAYAQARGTIDASLRDVVRDLAADVMQEETRVRPDLRQLEVTVERQDGGQVAIVLRGLLATDLGTVSPTDVTDEVAVRAQAWLKRVDGLADRLASTNAAIRLEQDVLRQIRLGFNPNATVEFPAAAHIPAANAPEVDAVAPAVRLPPHVASDPRSASFAGTMVLPVTAQPVDVDARSDRPQT